LQGELQRATPNAPKVYNGLTDVFVKTWKNEGIRGLQRGLGPAVSPESEERQLTCSTDIKWVIATEQDLLGADMTDSAQRLSSW
jgi:hypothetical protein